jgi:hypothetical protein
MLIISDTCSEHISNHKKHELFPMWLTWHVIVNRDIKHQCTPSLWNLKGVVEIALSGKHVLIKREIDTFSRHTINELSLVLPLASNCFALSTEVLFLFQLTEFGIRLWAGKYHSRLHCSIRNIYCCFPSKCIKVIDTCLDPDVESQNIISIADCHIFTR